jgi:hypothetical protein
VEKSQMAKTATKTVTHRRDGNHTMTQTPKQMAREDRERKAERKRETEKRGRKADRKRHLETHLERNGAHAYAERVPIMRDELADGGGTATVKELFKALKTSPTGLFATERRVAATYRYDQRQESPIFDRSNGSITLRKRSTRKPSTGTVSRKRTRKAA